MPLWLFLLPVLLLSACTPPAFVDATQPVVEELSTMTTSAGQTFMAQHGGLMGIELYLAPGSGPAASVTLGLRSDPASQQDLVKATLPGASIAHPGYYRFTFPPLNNTRNRSYYAQWQVTPPATLQVGIATGQHYLDGARYENNEPDGQQTAFRLIYAPNAVALDLLQRLASVLGWMGLLAILFVAPGLALLRIAGIGAKAEGDQDWAEQIAVAAGLGLAFYPVLLVWTHLAGLSLGAWHVWLTLGAALLILLWRGWKFNIARDTTKKRPPNAIPWSSIALAGVVISILFTRLLVIGGLAAPLWGDSVQHATMAQLIVDQGGLFQSWEPYAPYATLTTHFGFSALTAVLTWATGMNSVQATLVFGQLINGLAVFTLYPLAKRIANGNRWAGVAAVLAVGLISPHPAFYVNWGRYAQLAGQTILPVALWLLWRLAEEWRRPDARIGAGWQAAFVLGCTLCGMMLTYYRMPYYFITFVLPWICCWALPAWRSNLRVWLREGALLGLAALFALALFLPWALNAMGSNLVSLATTPSSTEVSPDAAALQRQAIVDYVRNEYRAWLLLPSFVPWSLLSTAGIALLWSLAKRRGEVLLVWLWLAGLASLVASQLLGLPGANLMQNFAVLIALYIPVGICAGWVFGALTSALARRLPRLAPPLALACLALLGGWHLPAQLTIIQPQHIMVTQPDLRAMRWIAQNTPANARFLVEGFSIMEGVQAVGADAGWWLPLLAGRANTMPPQYAMLNEQPKPANYTQRVVELVQTLEAEAVHTPPATKQLCAWEISHIYIGQRQGAIGFGVIQLFTPEELNNHPAFQLLYHADLVHIYAFNHQVCANHAG